MPRGDLYGLTEAQVLGQMAAQGGVCGICGTVPRQWVIDHDHERARMHPHGEHRGCADCVRGLICDPCNRGLAAFRDDPDVMETAAAYVRASR
jgi:hypothetical protein